jgi:hypothetical protein
MEMVMAQSSQSAVRPFRIEVSQASLDDLRMRVLATRWPTKELVNDRSQGVQLATLKALARSWPSAADVNFFRSRGLPSS